MKSQPSTQAVRTKVICPCLCSDEVEESDR